MSALYVIPSALGSLGSWAPGAFRVARACPFAKPGNGPNMCEGNLEMIAKLESSLARRFSSHCYQGGHMIYRDPASRIQLSTDIKAFVARR